MYCKKCGKEVGDTEQFCSNCGEPQTQQATQPVQQAPVTNADDASNTGFAVLSFFFPMVGIILFLVWNKDYPLKAKSCLHGFIAGVALYVVFICCMFSSIGSLSYRYGYYYNAVRSLF